MLIVLVILFLPVSQLEFSVPFSLFVGDAAVCIQFRDLLWEKYRSFSSNLSASITNLSVFHFLYFLPMLSVFPLPPTLPPSTFDSIHSLFSLSLSLTQRKTWMSLSKSFSLPYFSFLLSSNLTLCLFSFNLTSFPPPAPFFHSLFILQLHRCLG